MNQMSIDPASNSATNAGTVSPGDDTRLVADMLFKSHLNTIHIQTDRLFAGLMICQWVGCVIAALVIAPRTWIGLESYTSSAVWAAVLLGGVITIFPVMLAMTRPGEAVTRYTISVAQMVMGSLLIHVTGGRIETHFHVFGSLAFLAFYRDWRVLVPATLIVALDHFFRGFYFPQSVYGVFADSRWRFLEHAGWVIFEDVFLVVSCIRGQREMREIAERTAELSHATKVAEAATAIAETANRSKSDFLARMSHEIRTPLNGVLGTIDLMQATGMTDMQRRYARLAREAGDSLMIVINDILDFSKIEAGKVEIEAVESDLRKLMEDLTELLTPMATKKSLSLACFLRPGIPQRLTGDPHRIRQILTNLVMNAIKFTSIGSVSIRAAAERDGAGRCVVRIEVQDTGIGIPADRLDCLFKSFSQVDTSTTRKFGGTGLGLAISKRLVELMGGEIGIESAVGRGTTFWFTLTLDTTAFQTPEDLGPSAILRSARVLAVDSDPQGRRILTEQLEERLSPGSAVVHPEEALLALRRAAGEGLPYTVAMIPQARSGRNLIEAIRSDAQLEKTSLVAVLEAGDEADETALRAAGFIAKVQKPFTQSRVLDAIASATIRLPMPEAVPQAPARLARDRGLHLLVAEDNEMNQFVTQETLRLAGCTCDIVGDGLQAVEAVERRQYDAVLMDCQMPVMDGLEAARQIRSREAAAGSLRKIPIIALTADALQGDRERCLSAGMDGYVTKPIDVKDLLNALDSLARPKAAIPTPA